VFAGSTGLEASAQSDLAERSTVGSAFTGSAAGSWSMESASVRIFARGQLEDL
jgi:hypothetical protein